MLCPCYVLCHVSIMTGAMFLLCFAFLSTYSDDCDVYLISVAMDVASPASIIIVSDDSIP